VPDRLGSVELSVLDPLSELGAVILCTVTPSAQEADSIHPGCLARSSLYPSAGAAVQQGRGVYHVKEFRTALSSGSPNGPGISYSWLKFRSLGVQLTEVCAIAMPLDLRRTYR
jgi:hypothetical protein